MASDGCVETTAVPRDRTHHGDVDGVLGSEEGKEEARGTVTEPMLLEISCVARGDPGELRSPSRPTAW